MGTSDHVRARVLVRGRVQGVGFRVFAVRAADGVSGAVGNLADGSVECIAEGPKPDVDRLIERLREGPMMARVESIEVFWEPPSGSYTSMGIH